VYSDILDGGSGRLHCQLVVVDGPDRGRACRLADEAVTIGTETGCDLVLSDDRVSGRHVTVRAVESRFAVRDLGSTNGTWIELDRVEQHELSNQQEFRIGSHVLMFIVTDVD